MGGQISALHPKDPGFEYMAVTVRSPDTIGLIYASEQELNVTREVIQQTWPKGIQNEASQLGEAFMFKLKGNPFKGGILSNAQDLTNARLLICHLLYRLHNSGWKLICSSDLQRLTDLTTWFFVKSAHDFCSYVFGCISLSSSDTLQVRVFSFYSK